MVIFHKDFPRRTVRSPRHSMSVLTEAADMAVVLDALRTYWKEYRPNSPEGWLFPGFRNIGHLTRAAIALAFDTCKERAGITKEVSPHSLRHAFATHLLEDGIELIKIKELLGHYCISSTMVYLHLSNTTKGIVSPADKMEGKDG